MTAWGRQPQGQLSHFSRRRVGDERRRAEPGYIGRGAERRFGDQPVRLGGGVGRNNLGRTPRGPVAARRRTGARRDDPLAPATVGGDGFLRMRGGPWRRSGG